MRKKSHILLAQYLADGMMTADSLQSHRIAFCLGSILPDIRPSFVTKRHEFIGTFSEIQEKLLELLQKGVQYCNERVFWRRLGEIIHYIADYFTYPHNKCYPGNFYQHNKYEKNLKDQLYATIKSGKASFISCPKLCFDNSQELISYIRSAHNHYLEEKHGINEDIHYILMVSYQVIQGVMQICARQQGEG